MIDLKGMDERLRCVSLIRSADFVEPNTLRLSTYFKYPDGSFIDVYIESDDALQLQLKVSDLSQTFTWLLDLNINVPRGGRRLRFLQSVLTAYDVNVREGEVLTYVNDVNGLPDAILNIAQAALRISDLMFTQRLARKDDFNSDFEDFLEEHELTFTERRFEIHERTVVIPYYAKSNRVSSLIQTISTTSSHSAPQIAKDAFVRWYDIGKAMPEALRVTVFDDFSEVIQEGDLDRMRDFSKVIAWSDQSTLIETLVG